MKPIHTTFLAAASAAFFAAAASTQVTLETATTVGAFAHTRTVKKSDSRPKGTRVAPGLHILVRSADSFSTVVGQTQASFRRSGAVLETTLTELGQVDNGAAVVGRAGTLGNAGEGPHSYLLRDPAPSRRYRVEISFAASTTTRGASTYAGVDLNNDLRDEWFALTGNVTKTFDITSPTTGLAIRMTTKGLIGHGGRGQGKYTLSLTVKVTDQGYVPRCSFRTYGVNCGPALRGSEIPMGNGVVIQFRTSGAQRNAPAVFLLGSERSSVRFPGTNCFLSVTPVVLLPHATDANGWATLRFPLPAAWAGKLSVQNLIIASVRPTFAVQTTRGITMTCR